MFAQKYQKIYEVEFVCTLFAPFSNKFSDLTDKAMNTSDCPALGLGI